MPGHPDQDPATVNDDELSREPSQRSQSQFAAPAPVPVPPTQPPQAPKLNYDKPPFSRVPDAAADSQGRPPAFFEVIKNGTIIESCPLASRGKEFLVFGRVPTCDVELEHPSISRLHAVVQFGPEDSVLLFDLDSAHHTFVNKARAPPRTYVELHEGDQVRFGASTRVYVLQGRARAAKPPEAEKPTAASKKTLTGDEAESMTASGSSSVAAHRTTTTAEQLHEVTWGFDDDAEEDNAGEDVNDDAEVDQNAYYVKDPRKALRVWAEARFVLAKVTSCSLFEFTETLLLESFSLPNRGVQIDFEHEEEGKGHERVYLARLRLPLGSSGSLTASGTSSRKKDAEREACLDACAKLDRRGLLRVTESTSSKKRKNEEDDLDDSLDNFYDRAGTATKSKKRAVGAAGKDNAKVETFESLSAKKDMLVMELGKVREDLEKARDVESTAQKAAGKEDDLDIYLAQVKTQDLKLARQKLESREASLIKELARTERFLKYVQPVEGFGSSNVGERPQGSSLNRDPQDNKTVSKSAQTLSQSTAQRTAAVERPSENPSPQFAITEDDKEGVLRDAGQDSTESEDKPEIAQREDQSGMDQDFETPREPQPKRRKSRTFGPTLPVGSAQSDVKSFGFEPEEEVIDAVHHKESVDVESANSAYGY